MEAPHLTLKRATAKDANSWASCFLNSFSHGTAPQVPFYAAMFPKTDGTHAFFAKSFAEQMRTEPQSHFIHVVDESDSDKIVGFAKWTPPGSGEAFWAPYGPEMNESVCDEFFGAMAEHREKLMGKRPHWFLEIMGVDVAYQWRGVGGMMMEYGCGLVDASGEEAYVDSSPLGKGLYEKFGFESRACVNFSEPFGWYREEFMVRPVK